MDELVERLDQARAELPDRFIPWPTVDEGFYLHAALEQAAEAITTLQRERDALREALERRDRALLLLTRDNQHMTAAREQFGITRLEQILRSADAVAALNGGEHD